MLENLESVMTLMGPGSVPARSNNADGSGLGAVSAGLSRVREDQRRFMSSPLSPSGDEQFVPSSAQLSRDRDSGTGLIDAQRQELLKRDLAARVNAGAEGRAGAASLYTVCRVLAGAVIYYVSTQI